MGLTTIGFPTVCTAPITFLKLTFTPSFVIVPSEISMVNSRSSFLIPLPNSTPKAPVTLLVFALKLTLTRLRVATPKIGMPASLISKVPPTMIEAVWMASESNSRLTLSPNFSLNLGASRPTPLSLSWAFLKPSMPMPTSWNRNLPPPTPVLPKVISELAPSIDHGP